MQTTVQPVFVSRKIDQDLKVRETKPQIVNQQRAVYRFQCDPCDADYVGYTRGPQTLYANLSLHLAADFVVKRLFLLDNGVMKTPKRRFFYR